MATSDSKQQAVSSDLAETAAGTAGAGEMEQTNIVTPDASASPSPSKSQKPQGRASGDRSAQKSAGKSKKPTRGRKTYLLGDFELRKELGQGGMGKVFLARQISLDRDCALKVMSAELAKREGFVQRFIREARSMAKIDHPNVVKCYAVGEHEGKHFVAMEFIDGRSMQDWLDDLDRLSVPDALHVTLLCADALQHAHKLNMIHRDIKPDNILVTKNGLVKVADLGLAKATDEDMSMTQSGTGLGTPHYMPPEQARNAKHVDSRCDIYALGCTLYHCVTGKLPFAGETVLELITNKEKGQFTPARRINSDVPERLDLIIDKMMAKDPKYRYESCDELIRDLESLNLAAESLSFIDSDEKAVLKRSGTYSTPSVGPPSAPGAESPGMKTRTMNGRTRSGGSSKQRRSSTSSKDLWYLRYTDSSGKIKVSRMSTDQVRQAMQTDKLDLKTRATRDPKRGEFLPLAQYPIFEEEAQRMVTRVRVGRRDQGLAEAYKSIEKQYNRQKWWRLLARFRDGTLGFVGLILWLVIVAGAVVALGFGVMWLYDYLGSHLTPR